MHVIPCKGLEPLKATLPAARYPASVPYGKFQLSAIVEADQLEAALNEKRVLDDHVRKKRKLQPPIRAMMGDNYQPYSWAHQVVPEILWIAMLQEGMGMRNGIDFIVDLVMEAGRICTTEPKPIFAKITSFELLTDEQKTTLIDFISKHPAYDSAMNALLPFFILLPNSPLSFLRLGPESVSRQSDHVNL